MKTKRQLLLAYQAGRNNLMIMIVLTAANVALALSGSTWSFLFTAFFPYICANLAQYGYLGLPEAACVAVGCALPLALWLACWFLSGRRRYGWLKAAAALFALDAVYMVYFFFAYGFDAVFVIAVLFHAFILWQFIGGSVAAKHLAKGDFEEAPSPDAPAKTPVRQETDGAAAPAVFRYDRAYARGTGANKAGKIALTFFIFLVWMVGGAALSIWLIEEKLAPGAGAAVPAAIAVCLSAVAWFIAAMIRLSAFLEAAAAVYQVSGSGVLTRDKADIPPFNHTVFNRLEILEERDDRWIVGYENAAGKQKKAVIPKAYPGLERYMAAVGPAL